MYLSKLELVGFKSFPQKTNFLFSDGITAIVGPNGCGKTNIVDAIRWVLGEQKTAVLRSDAMENVIFNGTKSRKPLGMAEVAMTLVNNKGILPTEYSEVTVTRRLFRSGESQYLLNKSKCRLKDIVELFMDTGMAADSYSVIELKMIDAILSGRVDERRHLIEEAAGVNKYKARRKEAVRKLNAVRDDITRVEDIIAEVQKNVNSLYRQASKTRRFNKLTNELKEIDLKVLQHEYYYFTKEIEEYQQKADAIKEEKTKTKNELEEIELHTNELREKKHILSEQLHTAQEKEAVLSASIAQKKQDIAVWKEKLSNSTTTRERLKKEIEDTGDYQSKTNSNLADAREQIKKLEQEKSEKEQQLEKIRKQRNEEYENVREKREIASDAHEELISLRNKIDTIKEQQKKEEHKITSLKNKILKAEHEIRSFQKQAEDLNTDLQKLSGEKEKSIEELETSEENLSKGQSQKAVLSAEIDDLRTNISDKKNELSRKRATLDFLESLVDSDETTKFLQKSDKWKAGEDKIPLAEAVGTDEKFLVAVDAALGEAGRYFIVKDRKEAISGIELLKSANKGKTAFISTSDIPSIEPPQRNGSVDGEFGWVSELVRVDDNIRNALRALIGNMMIIDTRENAVKAIDSGSAEAAVTLDGEIIRRGGIIKGGAGAKKESITIGKRERIKKINSDIKEISEKMEGLENKFHSLKNEHDSIDLKTLNDAVRAAESAKNHNENKISQLNYRKEILENNLSHIRENIEGYKEELNMIGGGSGFAERIESLEKETSAAKENHREKENDLDEAEESLHETEEKLRYKEKELVRSSSAIETTQRDIRTFEQRLSGLQRNIKEKNDEIHFSEKLAEEVSVKIANAEKELEKLEVDEKEAGNKREFLNAKVESIDEQIGQQSETIKKLRSKLDKLSDEIYDKELIIGQIDSRRSNIEVKADENYNVSLKDADFAPDKEFDLAETKNTIKALNEKLQKIGPINHMAVVDYEKESERLRFYKKQVEDLTESEKTLRETIKEINNTAEKQFIETFDKIRANFKMLFKKLFGEEGECEISLEEGNPLDSDISIMAKPPGKRPYSIEGISSGEKALTAIALLFAIYLVKPSPFCILDEVDAPLDDNNIGRFLKMIRDFSKDTQFLIVTHNKITMEASDTLYGITMPEKGVSKVVSVKLAQTLAG